MKRRGKLVVAAAQPLGSVSMSMEWTKCMFCQKDSGDGLICSGKAKGDMQNRGYVSLSPYLEQLKELRYTLPSGIALQLMCDGSSILDTLISNEALWHKTCLRPFQPPKIQALIDKLKQEQSEPNAATIVSSEPSETVASRPSTRSTTPAVPIKNEVCFLCAEPAYSRLKPLRHCETIQVYEHIKKCAESIGEWHYVGVLSDGDLVAQEAKYHPKCLVSLYNRCRQTECKSDEDKEIMACESMAFAGLIMHIQAKLSESPNFIFRMGDLYKQFCNRIDQLLSLPAGSTTNQHTTRIRLRILAHLPYLKAVKSGREYVLMRDNANILPNIHSENDDEDALGFLKFVRTVRKVISTTHVTFQGKFDQDCQRKSIPSVLLAAVNALLYGSSSTIECGSTQPALTISQLVMCNFKKTVPKGDIVRMKKDCEPPLPMYIALSSYAGGRDRARIDKDHRFGISYSSTSVMEVTSKLSHLAVKRAEEDGVLCPSNLKKGIFTVSALDNIDFKCRSTTGTSEFHGTGISLMQLPCDSNSGTARVFKTQYADIQLGGSRSVPDLPQKYADVRECVLPNSKARNTICSAVTAESMLESDVPLSSWHKEDPWLSLVHDSIEKEICPENVSWSAFHASKSPIVTPSILSGLLPLFEEKSQSASMVKHGIDVVRDIIRFLNVNQIPVLGLDQPLYWLAKLIQWNFPDIYGEEKLVLLLGPLHIEQAFLRAIGNFMAGCGWPSMLANAGVTSVGSAEADLKVTNITRARLNHEVTAATLYSLLLAAYNEFVEENADDNGDQPNFEEWIKDNSGVPLFTFWLTVLNLEIILLTFVRSIRTGNFLLFKDSIKTMLPWFFALDHQLYAKSLSVHLKDLEELSCKAPTIHAEFLKGNFVVRKTSNPYSAMGIDQAHEQCNADIKAGGIVGLTHDSSAMRRVMVSGPEVVRLLAEFEGDLTCSQNVHHEQYPAFQKKFFDKVVSLRQAFIDNENPFAYKGSELIRLDTRIAMPTAAIDSLTAAYTTGKDLFESFVSDRLASEKISIHDTMKKVTMKIFTAKQPVKKKSHTKSLKAENNLFWRLYSASLARDLDLSKFFQYENQEYPPALSNDGNIRAGKKADLVKILINEAQEGSPAPVACDGVVIDGAGIAHVIVPRQGDKSFQNYCKQVKRSIDHLADSVKSVNVAIAWDLYNESSIKASTREKRGDGPRMPNLPQKGEIPKDWVGYLSHNDNKVELFSFLAEKLLEEPGGLNIVTNVNETILASGPSFPSNLRGVCCSGAEEADGRLLLHVQDMVENGAKSVLIRSTDTDVVVLAISFFFALSEKGLEKLWVLYGVGSKAKHVPIHAIAHALGEDKSVALRGFHSFTGCDSVSFFSGRQKTSCYQTWKQQGVEATLAFKALATPAAEFSEDVMPVLERFAVLLYDKSSTSTSVDATRLQLFIGSNKPLTLLPPTAAALRQHTLRAFYQAGVLWGNSLNLVEHVPSPCAWGWFNDKGSLRPVWTTLPDIWAACRELDKCSCKTPCNTMRCCCRRAGLHCIPNCGKCKGEACSNKADDGRSANEEENELIDPDDPDAPL